MSDMTAAEPDELLAEALLNPEGRADPYPLYAALRERAPAFRTAQGPVVVARYADCEWVLRDPRFGNGTARPWERHGLTEAEWHERFPGPSVARRPRPGRDARRARCRVGGARRGERADGGVDRRAAGTPRR
jgi:cytochrome P450